MTNLRSVLPLFLLTLLACSSSDSSNTPDATACPNGYESCGTRCMPKGNSCCPDDGYSCAAGTLCNPDNLCAVSNGDQAGCKLGYERCNAFGCMPAGATCCAKDASASIYCPAGSACIADNKCQAGGSTPVTTRPTTNISVTSSHNDASTATACGSCSLTEKTCSQWISIGSCSIQSCTCRNSTGIVQLWYQTGSADNIIGCYACTGTSTDSCEAAARSATNACL